ncbi:MAG TPA: polymer-forming cytoskeletal protein [Bryobacteraceae bacterium]|nr:polymer-forming cytoskeletal protein [Bryobacteraceae bacterium]
MEGAGPVANVAVIGKGIVIRGDVTSKEGLHIDGEVEGTLQMSDCRLTISRQGKLGANVTAREIELMGVAHGNLEATSKITIRKGARLIGDLRAPGILIEEGAYVKGKIEIINSDPAQDVAGQPPARKAAAG